MFEYVKYNCHVMVKNEIGKNTPESLFNTYILKRKNGTDYVFDGVDCVVESVNYDRSRSCIITKIKIKDENANTSTK